MLLLLWTFRQNSEIFNFSRWLPYPWSYGSWIYTYQWNKCISTKSWISGRIEAYTMQTYVINFASDLRQVYGFFPSYHQVLQTIKLYNLLNWNVFFKVALNTKNNNSRMYIVTNWLIVRLYVRVGILPHVENITASFH